MAPTTQAAFARRHGVSKKTATVWKRQGRVVMVGSLVDVAALSAGLALHLGDVLAAIGAEPLGSNPDAPIFHPDKRRAVDWAALAEDAGGVFDRAACEAHLAATYGGNAGTLRTGRTRGGHPISRLGPATPPHGAH